MEVEELGVGIMGRREQGRAKSSVGGKARSLGLSMAAWRSGLDA